MLKFFDLARSGSAALLLCSFTLFADTVLIERYQYSLLDPAFSLASIPPGRVLLWLCIFGLVTRVFFPLARWVLVEVLLGGLRHLIKNILEELFEIAFEKLLGFSGQRISSTHYSAKRLNEQNTVEELSFGILAYYVLNYVVTPERGLSVSAFLFEIADQYPILVGVMFPVGFLIVWFAIWPSSQLKGQSE